MVLPDREIIRLTPEPTLGGTHLYAPGELPGQR